jgi:tRNA (adenine57-N1/adenine58-N1)-methyltransferase
MKMNLNKVKENETVVLISKANGNKFILKIEDRSQKITRLGVFNPKKLLNEPYGSEVTLGSQQYWLLPAKNLDFIETIKRKAQIIIPKDAALIAMYCNLVPGSKVVEGGLGSGALTLFLLNLVGLEGEVTSYEMRKDFAKLASENIKRAVKADNWKLKIKDISNGIEESDLDAVILDLPEPWNVVESAYSSLSPGGILASYSPTVNQVEKMVQQIGKYPFIEIKTYENLQRELVVKDGATRPAYDMLGHTGYLTFARKVLE